MPYRVSRLIDCFFPTSHMNSNNNIGTGLSVGLGAEGKPDNTLNKLIE